MQFKCCAKNSAAEKNVQKTYEFLRAVSDPNRLKIICVLQEGAKCVCEIVPVLGISDKLVSHHLKCLKNIGLLEEERDGNFIRHSLNRKMIKKYKAIFNQIIK
ncbi:MAG: metalloregulator ArsR/SmtB family transcription factor [Candidatus Moraniibacteriota bacterium]